MSELLKEYQTLFYFVIYMVFMYYGLKGIGHQYDKMTSDKKRLENTFESDIKKLQRNLSITSNEEYIQKEREIKEDYHRSYIRINDDYKSKQLSLISQSVIIIGSLLIILVVVGLNF